MRKLDTYLLMLTILVAVLVFAPADLSAQRDTTAAAKADSISMYLTPLEYAFMMHEETRFMLRVTALGVGAELEVLPYFTLMGQVQFSTGNAVNVSQLNLTAQARWYYGSKEMNVRNMSGNYIALAYGNQALSGRYDFEQWQLYASWGIQRRFLDYGLIDLGINAGYGMFTYPSTFLRSHAFNEGYFIQSHGEVGLGFVFNKLKALDPERLCPALKCYEKESFLFKINTANLFSISFIPDGDRTELHLAPKIAVEQKLFNLPISIGADLALNYQWWKRPTEINNVSGYYGSVTGRVQTRYYYNLKSRIRKGKSGDGLSANYISGGVYQRRQFFSGVPNVFRNQRTGYVFTTGIQRTFSDHFYFDVEAGIQQDPYNPNTSNPLLYGDIQVGIKF